VLAIRVLVAEPFLEARAAFTAERTDLVGPVGLLLVVRRGEPETLVVLGLLGTAHFVYTPEGSSSSRIRRLSSSVGAGGPPTSSATRPSQPMLARTSSSVTPGCIVRRVICPLASSNPYVPRSVTTLVGPLPCHPRAASCAGSPLCPGDVRKSSSSTNE